MFARVASVAFTLALAACDGPPPAPAAAPAPPGSLDEFRAAAERIVRDAGVPGAGLALVRPDGIEWAGGVGFADRDARTPITADTHFRVGSISKTFVAMALVQQYQDGTIDIEAPVADLAPGVAIANPYVETPVTVLHLLQHTAGFDDMHFNEMYNLYDPPDLPLADVLARNPASRRVRWRPGTRMSYSNPGYAVAAYVLEQVTGKGYEEVIRERIFTPLGMRTSRFTLAPEDEALLARGYDRPAGPPVPFTPIYLRPAGNLHTSPRELGFFVRMLLNWGDADAGLVIDPEYLSNMERPRTSLSAKAGLLYGYGTGIVSRSLAGYPVLGHNGGIDGFSSAYGYAAARDAGWVVLVNASYAPATVDRLAELAVRYLKRDVDPPARPEHRASPDTLAAYAGYYHPHGSRSAILDGIVWLSAGATLQPEGNDLVVRPVLGRPQRLVPVSDSLFRREEDATPSRAFVTDEDGRTVLMADGYYGVRTPRWRVELLRVPVLLAIATLFTTPIALMLWLVRVRRAAPAGFWALKLTLCLLPVSAAAVVAFTVAPAREWGVVNGWTLMTCTGSWAVPLLSAAAAALLAGAWRHGAGPWLRAYASIVVLAGFILAAYLAAWGLVGFRPWAD